MKHFVFALAAFLHSFSTVSIASGATAWAAEVSNTVKVLLSGDENRGGKSAISPAGRVRTFDNAGLPIEAVRAAANDSTWTQTFAYANLPQRLASEIGAATRDAPLPVSVIQYLLPRSAAGGPRADETAVQWLRQQLRVRADQPVAVVFIYAGDADNTGGGRLLIILLAGERLPGDTYRVCDAVCGVFHPQN